MNTVQKFAQMVSNGQSSKQVALQMTADDVYQVANETRNRNLYSQWKKYCSGDYGLYSQTAAFRNLRESAMKVVANAQ